MKIEYTSVDNPRWLDAEQTRVLCDVKFAHLPRVLPFVAAGDDVEAHGRSIHADAVAGKYGVVAPYVASLPAPEAPSTAEELMAFLQRKADAVSVSAFGIGVDGVADTIEVNTTASGLAFLHGMVLSSMSDSKFTTKWYQRSGEYDLNAEQVLQLHREVGAKLSEVFAVRQQGRQGIGATPPAITSRQDVLDLPWPRTVLDADPTVTYTA